MSISSPLSTWVKIHLIPIVLLVGIAGATGGLAYALAFVPHRLFRNVDADLRNLAKQRPSHIPPGEWEFAVGWTLNLHANCGVPYGGVKVRDLRAFQTRLRSKMGEPVDMSTIDWIWDEYERITRLGVNYSQKHRPTRSPHLAKAVPGCFGLWVE